MTAHNGQIAPNLRLARSLWVTGKSAGKKGNNNRENALAALTSLDLALTMCPVAAIPPSAQTGTASFLEMRLVLYTAEAWARPTAHTCGIYGVSIYRITVMSMAEAKYSTGPLRAAETIRSGVQSTPRLHTRPRTIRPL